MTQEKEEYLVSKYPKIFRDINEDMTVTAMCWGVECRDGWLWILDQLCDCIQGYIDANPHLEIPQVIATQVKEKYGDLRFYYNGGDSTIHGMVWLAEHMSWNTCEDCGSTEDIEHTEGWVHTWCKKCANKAKNKTE